MESKALELVERMVLVEVSDQEVLVVLLVKGVAFALVVLVV